MENFWDFNVWGAFNLVAVLLFGLLVGHALKRTIPLLKKSLIPTAVLGGVVLLLVSILFKSVTGQEFFNTEFFGGKGSTNLEVITYHALALGFIASALRNSQQKMTKARANEVFNSGVTTVSTYLLQAVLGLGITIVAAMVIADFFPAAGVLLPFGYGQGTGQAMNYGTIYENDFGFTGGKSFGLTIAAMGFISASIGGVIHLYILRKKGRVTLSAGEDGEMLTEGVEDKDELPMQSTLDKMTIQIALIALSYFLAQMLMFLLGLILPGMKSVIYGFNFLLGVMAATVVKTVLNFLLKKKRIRKKHTNNFLLTRASNFCFDLMVVAGIAAIRLDLVSRYWGILLILGVVGLVSTYWYNNMVARKLFRDYQEEQFVAMYGMLTGTASTGIMLLRELDSQFKTPAADNLVYQNFPAIVFGFPMMLLAVLAPKEPMLTLGILAAFFLVMNVILFRAQIFGRKKEKGK